MPPSGQPRPDRTVADHAAAAATVVAVLISRMSLDEKIGQMTQAERASVTAADITAFRLGSILSGGGSAPTPNTATSWANMFPHNIGLGATRDPALAARVGRAVAEEVSGTGVDWTFAPCLCVARNDRWGRTYESFGEKPEPPVATATIVD